MKRLIALVTLGMAAVLVASACGSDEPTATPRPAATATTAPRATAAPTVAAAPTPTPAAAATATLRPATPTAAATATPQAAIRRGGVLRQAISPATPTASRSIQQAIRNTKIGPSHAVTGRSIYKALFQYDPYKGDELSGNLAQSWQFNTAADAVTIKIHPDAVWSDGKPVIAQDVKFTIDTWRKPPEGWNVINTQVRTAVPAMKDVQIVDDRTILITLTSPNVSFVALLSNTDAVILPAHRTLEQSATDPVGTGAFLIKDVETDIKFTLTKNTRYWMKDAQGGQLPYLDGVENINIADAQRAYSALVTGQIDVAQVDWSGAVAGKEKEVARTLPKALLPRSPGGLIGYGPKNIPPFNNQKLLDAMTILTDRLLAVEIWGNGFGVIDGTGVTPTSAGGKFGLPVKEMLSRPGWRYLDKKTGALATDMDKLREGLTGAYVKDPKDIELGKKLLKESGLDPLPKITLTTRPGRFTTLAEVISQNLKEYAGANVVINVIDDASFDDARANGKFEWCVFSIYPSTPEPSDALLRLTTGNGFWAHGFTVPELDRLYDLQKRQTDPAKRLELIQQMQRAFLDKPHVIPEVNGWSVEGIIREWVKNWAPSISSASQTYTFDKLWLEPRTG